MGSDANGYKMKILIVDDDDCFHELIQSQFRGINVEMMGVKTSMEALRVCQTFHPTIIILDIFLDHESGFKLCKQLKKICDAKIIMASGSSPSDWSALASMYGADEFLKKPMDLRGAKQFVQDAIQ